MKRFFFSTNGGFFQVYRSMSHQVSCRCRNVSFINRTINSFFLKKTSFPHCHHFLRGKSLQWARFLSNIHVWVFWVKKKYYNASFSRKKKTVYYSTSFLFEERVDNDCFRSFRRTWEHGQETFLHSHPCITNVVVLIHLDNNALFSSFFEWEAA